MTGSGVEFDINPRWRISSTTICTFGKHDPKHIGVAVGISLLSCLEDALCVVKV